MIFSVFFLDKLYKIDTIKFEKKLNNSLYLTSDIIMQYSEVSRIYRNFRLGLLLKAINGINQTIVINGFYMFQNHKGVDTIESFIDKSYLMRHNIIEYLHYMPRGRNFRIDFELSVLDGSLDDIYFIVEADNILVIYFVTLILILISMICIYNSLIKKNIQINSQINFYWMMSIIISLPIPEIAYIWGFPFANWNFLRKQYPIMALISHNILFNNSYQTVFYARMGLILLYKFVGFNLIIVFISEFIINIHIIFRHYQQIPFLLNICILLLFSAESYVTNHALIAIINSLCYQLYKKCYYNVDEGQKLIS